MKQFLSSLVLILFFLPLHINAQKNLPPGAEGFYTRVMAGINPKHVSWIKNSAKKLNAQNGTEADARQMAQTYGSSYNFNTLDIDALVTLVMMEASKNSDAEMRAMSEEMNAANKQKNTMRDGLERLQNKNNPVSGITLDSFKLLLRTDHLASRPFHRDSISSKPSREEVSVVSNQLKTKYDSLGRVGQELSGRIRIYQDRYSRNMETLSTLMKKLSDTDAQIISNLK